MMAGLINSKRTHTKILGFSVLTILTMWVENHGMLQDDPQVVLRLKDFLSMIVSPPTLALSAKLLLQSIDKLVSLLSV